MKLTYQIVMLLVGILCTCVPAHMQAQLAARGANDLYALDQLVDIEIQMKDTSWRRKLSRWKENYVKDRIIASVSIDGKVYNDVGVRYKGNSSYNAIVGDEKDKLPFNLKISYEDKEQRVQGRYRTLKLSNAFRDPSYLREPLSYAIAREYMASPRCNYARLTIDGRYYGIYNLTESIDEQFWSDHFNSDEGILFKCDPESKDPAPSSCPPGRTADLTYLGPDSACYAARYELKKSEAGWAELIDLTKRLEKPDPEIERWLNVDETLWMHAFNNALVNLDSYLGMFCHNYYLFKDTSGVWHPVIWDMNLSIGGFRGLEPGKLLTDEEMFTLSPFVHLNEGETERPLIKRLLTRPLFRKMYVAHLNTIYKEQFEGGAWRKKAEFMRQVVDQAVRSEPIPLYATETFDANFVDGVDISGGHVVGIEEFFIKRGEYLSQHPLFERPVPEIADHLATDVDGKTMVSVTLSPEVPAESVWVAHRPRGRGGFLYTQLAPDADGAYSVALASNDIHDYFLVAEGEISATVLPARSGREWFTVKR